eukprot:10803761-Alexandrium_andersonii.AAC.1
MSASLVGSEMCIRDSFTGEALAHAVAERRRGGRPLAPSKAGQKLKDACCLLYTSDAADDM